MLKFKSKILIDPTFLALVTLFRQYHHEIWHNTTGTILQDPAGSIWTFGRSEVPSFKMLCWGKLVTPPYYSIILLLATTYSVRIVVQLNFPNIIEVPLNIKTTHISNIMNSWLLLCGFAFNASAKLDAPSPSPVQSHGYMAIYKLII